MGKLDNDIDVKKFLNCLTDYRVEGEYVEYTHTAFGTPWGKYNVTDENIGKFINLYKKALNAYINSGEDESNWNLHITEKPKQVGQLVLNIDFRVKDKDRKYNEEHIKYIVTKFNNIIKKYINTTNKNIEAFVFEKDCPTYDNKQGNYKDGIHIIYPHIVIDVLLRYKFIEIAQNEIETEEVLNDIRFINKYDDVFDKSNVLRNGWMLYGSRKYKGQKYDLTKIYDHLGVIKHDIYSPDELVSLLYLRQYEPDDCMHLKDQYNNNDFNKELTNTYNKYHPEKQKKKKLILIDLYDEIDDKSNKEINDQQSSNEPISISDSDICDKPPWLNWTDNENKQILDLVKENKSINEITKIVNRTLKNVNYQLKCLAYSFYTKDKLSIDDISVLVGLTKDDVREYITKRWIYDSYKNNNTIDVDEISKLMGATKADVYKYMTPIVKRIDKYKKNNKDDISDASIKMPSMRGQRWTEEESEQILKEVKDGKSNDQISEIHQRTYGGIRCHLIQLAYKFHYNDNKSIKEINELTGLSESCIAYYFSKKESYVLSKNKSEDITKDVNQTVQKKYVSKSNNTQLVTKIAEIESNMIILMKNQNIMLNMLKNNVTITNKTIEDVPKQIQKKIIVKGKKPELTNDELVSKISTSVDNKTKLNQNLKQTNDTKVVTNHFVVVKPSCN